MRIIEEKDLINFKFWGPAKEFTDKLKLEEFDRLQEYIEDIYPCEITATELNDIFAYDREGLVECLGYQNEEEILFRDDPVFLFKNASEIIDSLNKEYLSPEFTLEDEDIKEFLKYNNMDKEEFVNECYKLYIGMLENSGSMKDVDDVLSDYEDTIKYIQNEYFIEYIEGIADQMSKGEIIPDIEDIKNNLIDKLEEFIMISDRYDEEYIKNIIDDIDRYGYEEFLEEDKEY